MTEKADCNCRSHFLQTGVHVIGCPGYKVPTHLPAPEPKEEPKEERTTLELVTALTSVEKVIELKLLRSIPPSANAHVLTGLHISLPTIRAVLKKVIEPKPSVGSDDFKEDCFALRAQVLETEIQTKLVFREHPVWAEEQTAHDINDPAAVGAAKRAHEHSEMKANLMLALRHLEDARMRLGKAIQAFDGGESCYPR